MAESNGFLSTVMCSHAFSTKSSSQVQSSVSLSNVVLERIKV